MGDIVQGWLDATRDERSHKRASEAWRAAKPFWARIRPGTIDKAMCETYVRQRGRAANTLRNELGTLRSACKWAVSSGIIKTKPPIWLPSMPESSVEHLSKRDLRALVAACVAPHIRLLAILAFTTGARVTACLELRWERVDLERRQIDLNPVGRTQVANKRRATVPINDTLYPALVEARAGALTDYVIEYHGGNIANAKTGFQAAARRAGVKATPHVLRHTAAVMMAEQRTPMAEIAAMLGHRNTAITERVYARFHPDYLQRAASALTL